MRECALSSVKLGINCLKIGSGVTPKGGDSVYIADGTALIRSQNVVACIGAKPGVASIAGRVVQTNQQNNSIVVSDSVYRSYVYFAACELKPQLEALGGGATMPNVNKSKFESLPMLKPSKSVLRMFEDYCSPLLLQIKNLLKQNQKLKQVRDLLLPKLMSGEIPV